jgi:hypothetical protein
MTTEKRFNPPPGPSTPKEAPWTDISSLLKRQDTIITQQASLIAQQTEMIAYLRAISGLSPGGTEITVPGYTPEAPDPTLLVQYPYTGLAPGMFTTDYVNFKKGWRLAIHIESTLNQAVTLQPIGNIFNSSLKASTIGIATVLLAGLNTTFTFGWNQWQSYIWVNSTIFVQPTVGTLTFWYTIQK